LHRVYKNLESFNISSLEATPGWAVGYWFIPILNLFKPLSIVNEVYNGSNPENLKSEITFFSDSSSNTKTIIWWLCWIFGNIISRIAETIERVNKDVTTESVVIYVISLLLHIIAGILLIKIIREIDNNQTECGNIIVNKMAEPPLPPIFEKENIKE
jgi:hypothetical protein